jgi:ACS family hexuronate transporter-like MFS transporter
LLIKQFEKLRWIIAGLLFLATLINYMDRQLLSVIAPMLRRDLHLTNTQYAYAVNSFLIAYGIMFTVGGWLIDLLHTRRGLALSLALWSLASLLHTVVVGAWDLCLYRFLLGVAEPGNFTASVKAVAAWFPKRERGVAIGFVVSGTGIGAIIAPPLVVWIALHFGWRMAFLLPSLGGVCWLPLWLYLYREPEEHPWITERERQHIFSDRAEAAEGGKEAPAHWSKLLGLPQSWSFILGRFFADPLGYFYWFWMPSYLVAAKGFSFIELGKWLWIPYLIQGIGQIGGGLFSGWLIQRGVAPILARKVGMSAGLLLTPVAILSLASSGGFFVLLYISVATFGLGWWGANYNSAIMDAVPRSSVASVAGLAGTGGVVSSAVVTWFTGWAADHHAYPLVFWVNTILMVVSVFFSWALLRKPVDDSAVLPGRAAAAAVSHL